jgi:hypothetical protein
MQAITRFCLMGLPRHRVRALGSHVPMPMPDYTAEPLAFQTIAAAHPCFGPVAIDTFA